MLNGFGSTHNLINLKLVKLLNCFIYRTPKYQVMIAYGHTVTCLRKWHSIKLNRRENLLDSSVSEIQTGGVIVILGVS